MRLKVNLFAAIALLLLALALGLACGAEEPRDDDDDSRDRRSSQESEARDEDSEGRGLFGQQEERENEGRESDREPGRDGESGTEGASTGDGEGTGVFGRIEERGDGSGAAAGPDPGQTEALTNIEPEGYFHGEGYGLALVQTTRMPSAEREGWVDITLSLVAVKHSGGELPRLQAGQNNDLCFDATDCFDIKWGSTEQNQAEMSQRWNEQGAGNSLVTKAINLLVTFQVAGNATNATLYFSGNKVPLDLQGDTQIAGQHAEPKPAPAPPASGDEKTANFFMGLEHGVAVTGVHRVLRLNEPWFAEARIEMDVLPPADYAASGDGANTGPDGSTGSICFGQGGTECLRVLWGENKYNAILTLEGGEEFSEARSRGARWPLPVVVSFHLPSNESSAVLEFGDHEIALDLQGMAGDPAYDYTAHYVEASPGSKLYDEGGKTVVLDSVSHDPKTGDIELSMTAANNNESADFSPAFAPLGVFSTKGQVDVTGFTGGVGVLSSMAISTSGGARPTPRPAPTMAPGQAGQVSIPAQYTGDTLAPGQTGSFKAVVPRAGNAQWGHIAWSQDPAKRADGVVVHVRDRNAPVDAAGPGGSLPAYVKYARSDDEGKYYPFKLLWSRPADGAARMTVGDGVVSLWHEGSRHQGDALRAVDSAGGRQLWGLEQVPGGNYLLLLSRFSGVDYSYGPNKAGLIAVDPATGQVRWRALDEVRVASLEEVDGMLLGRSPGQSRGEGFLLLAVDPASGRELWRYRPEEGQSGPYAVAGGEVFVTVDHGRQGRAHISEIKVLDAATGSVKRTIKESGHLSIRVADGTVYVGGAGGWLAALDAESGERIWSTSTTRLGDPANLYAVENGVVYMDYSALNAATGEVLWSLPIRPMGTQVVDGALYAKFRDRGGYLLYNFNAASGGESWAHRHGGEFGYFTEYQGVVYTASDNGSVAAVDASLGESLWRFQAGRGAKAVAAADGVVYVLGGERLYALLAEEALNSKFVSVSAGVGSGHFCAITDRGGLVCYGNDDYGQTAVPEGRFKSVSAGWKSTCAVSTADDVLCWGDNEAGQATPPEGKFRSVSTSGARTCAVSVENDVACWGDNGEAETFAPEGKFSLVSTGWGHSCSVAVDGDVVCLGHDSYGQASAPAGKFSSVSAGGAHACGVTTNGNVLCWGHDEGGRASPPEGRFDSVSAGNHHSCGVTVDGDVICWGPDKIYDYTGITTPPAGKYTSVSAGDYYTCAIRNDGALVCWGRWNNVWSGG